MSPIPFNKQQSLIREVALSFFSYEETYEYGFNERNYRQAKFCRILNEETRGKKRSDDMVLQLRIYRQTEGFTDVSRLSWIRFLVAGIFSFVYDAW